MISEPQASAHIVARPLQPALTRTLALAQRRDKPAGAVQAHVRDALLKLAD